MAVGTSFLAIAMIAFALSSVHPSHADGVCGDDVVDAGEMCDDGNLVPGDGCSSSCQTESCGNSVVDAKEQCDDGGTRSGDGCNRYCQIEFCGDRSTQSGLGEQCDDGNGVGGDGCSSSCQNELHNAPPPPNPTPTPTPTPPGPISPPSPPPPPVVISQGQAALAANFLSGPGGEDIKQYLTRVENLQLETIIQKIKNGRRLTSEERVWAEQLFARLEQVKVAERARYTDLLKQFIATPISSDVVSEKNLEKTRLVDVTVPVAIGELTRAVAVIRRGELQQQVMSNVALLHRQGISIEADIPVGYETYLTSGTRPIQVFTTLKALKEATEAYATDNLPASLDVIRNEANTLVSALPIFEREYGLDPDVAKAFLADITSVSNDVTKQDAYRVVAAVNRFLLTLQRENILTPSDLTIVDAPHAAAGVARISEEIGDASILTETTDISAFVQSMSLKAPILYKEIFRTGTIHEQRMALLQFLGSDDQTSMLMESLPEDRVAEFVAKYAALKAAVVVSGEDMENPCAVSMPETLRCTTVFLGELQDAVRSKSYFSRLVGALQDYFGIGQ